MTEQELELLAIEFITHWGSYQRNEWRQERFERQPFCRGLIEKGLVCQYTHPRPGEYTIHYQYTGTALFTGSGELAFTEAGLPFAKKICDLYRKQGSDMKVIKVEY